MGQPASAMRPCCHAVGEDVEPVPGEEGAVIVDEAEVASDLQEWFEVVPAPGEVGWCGGDGDVSLVIGGGSTGRRALWIFADTFITKYDRSRERRDPDEVLMPHSTVAVAEIHDSGAIGQPKFRWRQDDASGAAISFLVPSEQQVADGELLWPVAGCASRDGKSVLLLCQRIKGFLNVVGTTIVALPDIASEEDPTRWEYSRMDIGTAELTWFSSIFFAEPSGDSVYILGHGPQKDKNGQALTVLARASFANLLQLHWQHTEYWVEPGAWSSDPSSGTLRPLGLPSWETTCVWSEKLGLWYSFNIPSFSYEVFLWTATEITGQWNKQKVWEVEAPFNASPWICYAAKAHPELANFRQAGADNLSSAANRAQSNPQDVELIFTWIPNALEKNVPPWSNSILFADGSFLLKNRGYWPRFQRLLVRRE